MKNFHEQFRGRIFSGQVSITQREFEEIQLYAWKSGMSKAAELVVASALDHSGQIADDIHQYRNMTDTLYPRNEV